jgi:hypothetical protein
MNSVASFVIGQMGVRLGQTTALLWSGTFAYAVNLLLCFALYRTYNRDAEGIQQKLAARREELTGGQGVGSKEQGR